MGYGRIASHFFPAWGKGFSGALPSDISYLLLSLKGPDRQLPAMTPEKIFIHA
jgi:hypothetical protein